MILVLCDEADVSALWAADALRRRGLSPTVLTGLDLAAVRGWRHTIGAAGAEVIGPDALAGPHRAACLRLARAAGCPLLGIDFASDADGVWRMTAASVCPELSRGGEALADALATALAP